MRLTKSDYLRYQKCPRYAWVSKHNPTRIQKDTSLAHQHAQDENEQLQRLARRLFVGGQSVKAYSLEESHSVTQQLLAEGASAIFGATALTDDLSTSSDVLEQTDAGWNIVEIRSAGSVQQKYLYSLAFQRHVWRQVGLKINRLKVGYINKAYVRGEVLDPTGLICIQDVTDQADELDIGIQAATDYVLSPTDLALTCHHPRTCPIPEICWSSLPAYSIYDIARLTTGKINTLRQRNVLSIQDVPDDLGLSPKQQLQVKLAKSGEVFIDRDRLDTVLSQLSYPLYFLDYEAFASAIPTLPGQKPYQQLVFQYSLHVVPSIGAEFEHKSFLSRDFASASQQVADSLRRDIGDRGSVVVWHKTFEMARHREMAELHPEHADFMHSLNQRIFDLRDIFEHQLYVDPRFRGGTSIKNVLPTLAPELSYKQLPIREGTEAAAQWHLMTTGNLPLDKQERIYANLAQYCYLDTLAMVKIFDRISRAVKLNMVSA